MSDALKNIVREAVAIAINDHVADNIIDELDQAGIGSIIEVSEIDSKSREQMIRVVAGTGHVSAPRYFVVKVTEML